MNNPLYIKKTKNEVNKNNINLRNGITFLFVFFDKKVKSKTIDIINIKVIKKSIE